MARGWGSYTPTASFDTTHLTGTLRLKKKTKKYSDTLASRYSIRGGTHVASRPSMPVQTSPCSSERGEAADDSEQDKDRRAKNATAFTSPSSFFIIHESTSSVISPSGGTRSQSKLRQKGTKTAFMCRFVLARKEIQDAIECSSQQHYTDFIAYNISNNLRRTWRERRRR
ncbi:hypothetical protein GQ600_968 [Phytophthora cactorum]|nr:hypothetical protein GQ600_968 [Phytophthora cactorum]